MDYDEVKRMEKLFCNEGFLTLLSGLRKTGRLTNEEISYNNALADVYDYIIETQEKHLHQHTVRCGKWVRDN